MAEVLFCPLAGISYNIRLLMLIFVESCFRPLAGISYNGNKLDVAVDTHEFPSPCGDKLQWVRKGASPSWVCFRPLAGINCNVMEQASGRIDRLFPSPYGDKLQY